MPEVSVSESLPVSIERAWEVIADLSRYTEWLTLLEAWRGDVPSELASGTEISAVVSAKGIRNRVTFVVQEYDPPHRISLVGEGVGGTKVTLDFQLTGSGETSKVDFDVDFQHPALRGPVASIAGRQIKGDLVKSLHSLSALMEG